MPERFRGVRRADLIAVKTHYPSIQAVDMAQETVGGSALKGTMRISPQVEDVVTAVRVKIDGIVGNRRTRRCAYKLLIDVSDLSAGLPPVWVESPADEDIRHVNIWRAGHLYCPLVGANLPSFCWGTMPSEWGNTEGSHRSLAACLELATQLLNSENHSSKARR